MARLQDEGRSRAPRPAAFVVRLPSAAVSRYNRALMHRFTRLRRWQRALLAGLALYLLALSLPTAWIAYHALSLRALAGSALLRDERSAARATTHLRGLASAAHGLRLLLTPPLWLAGRGEWLPAIGPTLGALPHLADAGVALLDTAAAAAPLLPALAAQPANEPSSVRVAAAVTTPAVLSGLETAAGAIGRATAARTAMGGGPFPGLDDTIATLDILLPPARALVEAAPSLPWLAGMDRPRHFLLLAQNSDELRATGGFITGIGRLTIDKGRLAGLDFQDSIEVDNWTVPHPDPPLPFTRYMGIDLWVTRDANWSPDFPTAAQQVVSLYQADTGQPVDGVIAADMEALALLVAGVGKLSLPQRGVTVTGETVLPTIEALWAPPNGAAPPADTSKWSAAQVRWWQQRKSFMPDLLNALIGRVQREPQRLEPQTLLAHWYRALAEKHLQLYFDEPRAQAWALAQGWGGALAPARPGDYLLVVESNMGYNKANRAVARSIDYTVDLTPATPEATLTLRYHHTLAGSPDCTQRIEYALSYAEMAARCYRSYVRVFAPPGARLRAATGLTDVETLTEDGRTVFGGFLALPPQQRATVTLQYTLPPTVIVNGHYHLTAQKQAGTTELPFNLVVRGGRVLLVTPGPAPTVGAEGDLRYALSLATDQHIRLLLP